VHRFAITYHKQKRKKSVTSVTLTKIDGIGEKRAKELLKFFRTIDNIKKATMQELESVKGMAHDSALSVYKHFHNNSK
jgi:excinuclease ABC subunit C